VSEEKRIELEIGWYKIVFSILVVTDLSLLGWISQNLNTVKPILIICTVISIVFITIGIYWVNKQVFKCLDRIEEL